MTRLLIVEDNERLRKMLAMCLSHAGYFILEAENGLEALDILDKVPLSLMIVDIMMPKMDGLSLTEELRKAKYTLPILIITAKETMEDKRRGFGSGADDYMVKPINTEELLMRVEALLRRSQIAGSSTLSVGKLRLNQDSLTTIREDKITVLPQKEFFLLQTLLSYPGKIFTRQALMDEIWGFDTDTDPRTVDVHIKRLREKYLDCGEFEIQTVRGLGYRAVVRP